MPCASSFTLTVSLQALAPGEGNISLVITHTLNCTLLLSPPGSCFCPPNLTAVNCSHGAPSDRLWLGKIKIKTFLFFFEEVKTRITYCHPWSNKSIYFWSNASPKLHRVSLCGSRKQKKLSSYKMCEKEITILFTNALITTRRVEWKWKLRLIWQGVSKKKESPERLCKQHGRWFYCCPTGHGKYPSELTCNTWISVDIK